MANGKFGAGLIVAERLAAVVAVVAVVLVHRFVDILILSVSMAFSGGHSRKSQCLGVVKKDCSAELKITIPLITCKTSPV